MEADAVSERTLWVDVTTLVGWQGNPTGIVRTVSQMVPHLLADDRVCVRLCRYDRWLGAYLRVEPSELAPAAPPKPPGWTGRLVRLALVPWLAFVSVLPRSLREAAWHQAQALGWLVHLLRSVVYRATAWAVVPIRRAAAERRYRTRWAGAMVPFAPGDVLFVAGAGWGDATATDLCQRLRQEQSVRVVTLVYDITPIRQQLYCRDDFCAAFTAWLPRLCASADLILTISEHSRQDLRNYGREVGLAVPPVEVIRLGDEPGLGGEAAPAELAAGQPFALFVSSILPHKNHRLLLQVWRRLLERQGERTPTLVLAGGLGWRAEEVSAWLATDPRLHGRVVHLSHVDDRQLRWLYRHCLFTLYPSLYEGWGLPVAESLMYGKYCVSSNASSLPEVGGDLVDYHDPLDGVELLRLVERALFEPGLLTARETRIRNEYRITSWKECAGQTLDLIDRHSPVMRRAAAQAA
ncbi:MAG: glycosyltransferase family 1 protein [Gemmataceae bacterium]